MKKHFYHILHPDMRIKEIKISFPSTLRRTNLLVRMYFKNPEKELELYSMVWYGNYHLLFKEFKIGTHTKALRLGCLSALKLAPFFIHLSLELWV
jgi:hypothetical protein